ncbi:hypothetical protein HPC49_54000, partial [Pyxidicoccus fallax]
MPASFLFRVLLFLALVLPPLARGAPDAFEAYLHPPHPPADGFTPLSGVRAGGEVTALAWGRVVEVG